MSAKAFYAYPGGFPIITEAVNNVAEASQGTDLEIKPWQNMHITGFKFDDLVRDEIKDADLLIADVTFLNFNVLYEIGYAIAAGKPVAPTVNTAVERAIKKLNEIAIFDNIGWITYQNSNELLNKLKQWKTLAWLNKLKKPKDHSQPMFLLDCLKKTDFRNDIVLAIENSHVRHRAFDPDAVPRLTAAHAIGEVSASAGVIIPILDDEIVDARPHNHRAAFLLGLAHGFNLEALAIQYGNGPAPADYRDFIRNSTFKKETVGHVERYCAETLVRNQDISSRSRRDDLGLLGQIDLGSSVAEYETQQLYNYFIRRAEYARAVRAEGAIVTGRKGSGKTAIFYQIIDNIKRDKRVCIVDLRPASHNLSEMRESLLSVVAVGVFDHTIAAFWQYVLLMEVLLKIREYVLPKSRNNFALQERIRTIEENFGLDEATVSGDFTSRLAFAVNLVIRSINTARSDAEVKNSITNLLFERPIPKIRDAIVSFSDHFSEISVLFDDLDKGWPPLRVEKHDVATIKHLVEALNHIRRDMGRKNFSFRYLVFLRSDIYERLVQETSDRGKYNVIKVDWSDPEQLRNLLRQRIIAYIDPAHHEEIWEIVNPEMSPGIMAIDCLIESSLRRPRFLIDLMERILSCAINRGHGFVLPADVEEGMRQMSLYLVSDFAYEMRDIAGTPEDIFYSFIGSPENITEADIAEKTEGIKTELNLQEIIEYLLWYGFLGLSNSGETIFIYDVGYDYRRLEAEMSLITDEQKFTINPAFIRGLQ